MPFYSDRTKQFFSYWDQLPKHDHLPDRKDFDPVHVAKHMAMVSIMEIRGPRDAHIRLAGTGVRDILGIDMTGQNYFDYLPDELATINEAAYGHLLGRPCGRHGVNRVRTGMGTIIRLELLTLPIRNGTAPKQLIIYNSVLEQLGFDEGEPKLLEIEGYKWIDLGAGVPDA